VAAPASTPARRRWESLPADAPREEFFAALHDALAESYLADPHDPYRQNGRSSGAARWEETRRCISLAVDRDGDFLDVGCANGLLLESLIGWCGERGLRVRPHGVDFIAPLVALARRRHPRHEQGFHVANAFYWQPPRRYDFVRTNLEFVRPADWAEWLRRHATFVADGGRLIVCHYYNDHEQAHDVAAILRDLGYAPAGEGSAAGVALAWVERPPS